MDLLSLSDETRHNRMYIERLTFLRGTETYCSLHQHVKVIRVVEIAGRSVCHSAQMHKINKGKLSPCLGLAQMFTQRVDVNVTALSP